MLLEGERTLASTFYHRIRVVWLFTLVFVALANWDEEEDKLCRGCLGIRTADTEKE